MASRDEGSVLGRTVRLVGRIQGEGALAIEGTLRGDVSVTGPLEIRDGASVQGNVHAESLLVQGTLTGDVQARGPIAIGPEAIVRGSLSGSRVSIDVGARVAVRMDSDFELDLDWGRTLRRRR
jgi:cytoskeletal protein CcmA (bactofilin family)